MPVPLGVKRGDFCRGSNERSDATAYESTIAALQRVGGGVTLAWVAAGHQQDQRRGSRCIDRAAMQRTRGGVTLAWVAAGHQQDQRRGSRCIDRAAMQRVGGGVTLAWVEGLDISRTSDAAADASIVPPCSA